MNKYYKTDKEKINGRIKKRNRKNKTKKCKVLNALENNETKVELDKAWETSLTRRLCICVLTYIVVVIYTYSTSKINNMWLSSLVPVIGFTLSTLSLKYIRKLWEKGKTND